MKKIFTTFCLVTITAFGFSQSIQLFQGANNVTNDTITVPITLGSTVHDEIGINNVSSNAINILVQRVILNPPLGNGCDLYFCTGLLCYAPSSNTYYNEPGSGTPLAANTNLPGANGLIPHFDVGLAECCDTWVLYKVYNTLSPNDTARVTMHYACANGVNDINKVGGNISFAYPNPANESFTVKIYNERKC